MPVSGTRPVSPDNEVDNIPSIGHCACIREPGNVGPFIKDSLPVICGYLLFAPPSQTGCNVTPLRGCKNDIVNCIAAAPFTKHSEIPERRIWHSNLRYIVQIDDSTNSGPAIPIT